MNRTKPISWTDLKAIIPRMHSAAQELNNPTEEQIQQAVENYLNLRGVKFVHIPKSLQRFIWSKTSHTPPHVAREASRHLKGIPDLLIFKCVGVGRAPECLILELKRDKGKVTIEQTEWFRLGMVLAHSFEEAREYIDKFLGGE